MKTRLLLGLILVLVLVAIVFLEPTGVLLGLARRENFFQSRPTTWWARSLKDKAPGASTINRKKLSDGGAAAAPVLIDLLQQDKGPEAAEVRREAAQALGLMGPEAKTATRALGEALHDSDPYVRVAAADALGKMAPEGIEAIPALIDMLATPDRLPSIKALTRYRGAASSAIPALVGLLKDPEPEVRGETCEALGDMKATTAVPALVAVLEDPVPEVRAHAAEALGEMGPSANEALPALRKCLKDQSEIVRREAKEAIDQIDPKAKEDRKR
jgi:HEAT repeat protein